MFFSRNEGKKKINIPNCYEGNPPNMSQTPWADSSWCGSGCRNKDDGRADKRFAALPVYAVTADVEEQKAFAERGFTGILLKPLTIDKLSDLFGYFC